MVANTNLKNAISSSKYYIMMLENLENSKKSKISNFFRISKARSAEMKQTTTAKRSLFAQETLRNVQESVLVYNNREIS